MATMWTAEQQKVIDLRNRNILVSAAAGSGKTAVLVERIIQRITDEREPVDVDRMLIVTYTEAAASEMKERIAAAIEKQLEQRPGDARLEQQAALIHTAPITTIHSFCLSVIRDHFHVIGIDPGFRIVEEGELKLLKQDVLDELLEECYEKGDEEFLEFTEKFGRGKNDRRIEELILKLYEFSCSYPCPGKWLDSCVMAYKSEDMLSSGFVKNAELRVRRRGKDIGGILDRALKICEEPDGPYMYADMIESDRKYLDRIIKAEDFEAMYDAVNGFAWKRLSTKRDETVSPEKKEEVKKLRKQAKKLVEGLQAAYFYASWQVWAEDMRDASGSMATLSGLVKQFSKLLGEKKRSRNMIDFNDMEHFALSILTEEKDGHTAPSRVAEEYQERFEEVMIDEYQDSNLVQEAILTSVSRMEKGQNNIFMVGDVKQSIYRFRLSRPELFMEKYDTYTLEDSACQRVDLHKNFRSRPEVLDSANYLFEQIMQRGFGGIEYDENAALYPGADFPEKPEDTDSGFSYRTELLLMDKKEAAVRTAEGGGDAKKAEARMIARRIRELTDSGMVYDRAEGACRRVRYRDIVILTRSIKGWAESFSSVLAEEGIPAYSVSREGYFETYEVSVLMDYLRILDNARQDLPLAAVLTSPFGGLDVQELARIRLAFPELPFYEAYVRYAETEDLPEEEGKTREKLESFYGQIAYFRRKVPYTPIHELLAEIIDRTGYGTYISAMPGGAQRQANVEMLVEKAAAFEGTSYKGLFNFIRYIEQLRKYDVDYGEAGILDEQADTVRIMSIHKSKGLEFPIVFAAGMGKAFNMQDVRGSVILHPELGAGLDVVDLEQRTKAPTFLKKMIQEEAALESLAEEMRVLYVAVTRAKEKMILTGVCDVSENLEERIREAENGENRAEEEGRPGQMELYRLEEAKTCLDWIIPAVFSGKDGRIRRDCPVEVRLFTAEDLQCEKEAEHTADVLARDTLEHWDCTRRHAPEYAERLKSQMEYVYPWEAEGQMKLKFTVSELKKRTSLQEEAGEEMYQEPEVVPLIPRFLTEEETLTGASRGSAYHKLLELLDFTENYDDGLLAQVIRENKAAGKLTGEMADCIRTGDILHFLNCESGRRMARAAAQGKLYREQPFVLGVPSEEIYPEDRSGETILVQGIIDVYFEEPDGLVVLDYKTDQVRTADELKEKYHAQLDYYAQALEQLTEKPVKEKIIYSFTLRKEIAV